ncbi:sarcosine oxidase subunit alpha family protein [Afifella sp. JA880]|uniref:sarcosine oxidase subunit alpha family protein n=1 Tax=Afifella sp. JA880 TaxID=2975280 RepID=UPI0021BA3CCE|nr:sarcosine oxidase subunit alpha family protein [Afifella sp. JA880]MCT8266712.1 sarcosine oxidase subunit alpha family protein [Afifella sp. JA880]
MSKQPFRTPQGGLVQRSRTIRFTYDGISYHGHPGDTLASALIANGRHMVARSFKYHRPRGIYAAGSADPAGLVAIGVDSKRFDPNTRAAEQEIYDGLVASSQNCWPSLGTDIGGILDPFWRFMPAGFYYKTFKGPPGTWTALFEPLIRAFAGLGRAPEAGDPDRYETVNRHCDVVVVGAGPAGLMAALAAGRSGARVILVEETDRLGGSILSRDPEKLSLGGVQPAQWVADIQNELAALPEVTILTRTNAFGYYGNNFLGLWEKVSDHLPKEKRLGHLPRQRLWRVRAKEVVLATGALERPLVFHENDRPGIMLASAARTFLHRYGVLAGKRPAIFTNNDTGWVTAFDLARNGAEIAGIIDVRSDLSGEHMAEAARLGIPIHASSTVVGTSGRHRVNQVEVRPLHRDGSVGTSFSHIGCDLLAVAGGYAPNAALFSQSRGKLRYDSELAAFRPGRSWQKERSAGACNGTYALTDVLAEGARAGVQAAAQAGFDSGDVTVPDVDGVELGQGHLKVMPEMPSHLPPHRRRAWIDLQDDVTTKDLRLALQEGYQAVEHAKRYTTTGMGNDQGKIANLNAFAFIANERGEELPAVGTTTFRQPYKPVTFAAIAGQHVGPHFAPRRTTPMHGWHRRRDAVFEPVGDWLRPRAYPREGEDFFQAVQREARAARTDCGVLDASTLGKIDVKGPDAREFLNRVYTNSWSKLAPGRCRYGLMLGEDGMVADDGVTACIADDHFHMTTTTGGAASVLAKLEDYLQTEWRDLKVFLTSVTEQWAVASICGPKSPALMAELLDDFDADPERFKFMDWRDATMGGIPVRVFRISFTGETSYEINIPATYGRWMWRQIIEKGARHGITPYGTEAMHLLRAEKGFVIVGQDTDGTVTPGDLRMDWIVKKNGDFIGRRSLFRSDTVRTDRRQLVGILTEDPDLVLEEGAHLIERRNEPEPPVPVLGHVTSSYYSPNIGRSIALALVSGGGGRIGDRIFATRGGEPTVPVRVTEIDFLDLKAKGALPQAVRREGGHG